MGISGIKKTLQAGATVFGASALLLIVLPKLFLELLGMETTDQLQWSMQMIGMYYETGRGVVTKDVNKAKEWYVKAIAQGSKKAQAKLDALNVNPAQDYRWVLRNNYQTMH